MCMCVCVCVCVCVRIHACMYACVYVCMYVCMYVWVFVCMYECMYVCMYVCVYACMYACMYVCMYVCLYVCMYVCMCACAQMFALDSSCLHVHGTIIFRSTSAEGAPMLGNKWQRNRCDARNTLVISDVSVRNMPCVGAVFRQRIVKHIKI